VDAGQRVHYRPVVVADDDGQTVRLVKGVDDGARVALNIGEDVAEGGPVQPVEPKPPGAAPGAPGTGGGSSPAAR